MTESNNSSVALGLMLRAATSLQQELDEILIKATGAGYAQYKILDVLSARGVISQKSIASALDQTEASISRQIKLLVKLDYITVKKNKKDSRQRDIKLTSSGKSILNSSSDLFFHFSVDKMNKLSPEEITGISESSQKLLIKND